MANVFDQFDQAPSGSNVFDQFDERQPGMLQSLGNAVRSGANAVVGAVKGTSENYPEMPALLEGNPEEARTPEGMLNIIRKQYHDAQLGQDKYGNPLVTIKGKAYYINKPGLSFNDVNTLKAGFNKSVLPVATSVAMGPAPWLVAAPAVGLSGMVSEGLSQGAANSQGANEGYDLSKMLNTGVSTMLGEVGGRWLSSILGALGRAYSKFTGKTVHGAQIIKPDGTLTDDAIATLKKMNVDPAELSQAVRQEMSANLAKGMPPDQALRAADFAVTGVKGTTGQVTRDFAQQQLEAEGAKSVNPLIGNPLRERAAANNSALLNTADKIKEGVGGQGDELMAGMSVKNALGTKAKEMQKATSNLYQAAREAKGINAPVPKKQFLTSTKEVLHNFEDVIPAPIKSRIGEIASGQRKLTVDEADKLRKLINARMDTPDKAAAEGMRQIKQALDDAVNSLGQGTDEAASLFTQGRQAAVAKHAEFSQKDIVQQIVTKKAQFTDLIPDEQVVKKVVYGGSSADLAKVKTSLLTGTPEQIQRGTEAWNNIRASTTRQLMDAALSGANRNEAGEVIFNATALRREMDRIGMHKLTQIYSPEEIGQIYALQRAGAALIPQRSAVNYSNTSSALLNRFNDIANRLPGGSYIADFWKRAGVKRALTGTPVTEQARAITMSRRIAPKLGAAAGSQR